MQPSEADPPLAEGGEPPEEAEDEGGLDPEARERRAAALAVVRTFGDPVLRSEASPVPDDGFDERLTADAERMVSLMQDAIGVGLAATQVGTLRRLLVFQAGYEATPKALVNPSIEWQSAELESAEEGCLSLPGVVVDVERPLHARVSGHGLDGARLTIEASGLEARVLQHEIDHLDGVLILDRTEREQRRAAIRALREGTTFSPAALAAPQDENGDGDGG